ncbi:MAG: ABC transporter permease [Andreesenia angusta]|nr:ABC transporter permease [Andreesenia angusta]
MKLNLKKKVVFSIVFSLSIILIILLLSIVMDSSKLNTNYEIRSLAPSFTHIFGTDWMGRDMLLRTVKGLQFSLMVGLLGAFLGVGIAIILGVISALGSEKVDSAILWTIDLFIGMPHLIFMILISFAVGKGAKGVVIATALTHWPALARLIRNEVLHLKNMEYINLSHNLGKSNWFVVRNHILLIIFPQILVGFLLLFPHVILHEASMTFLGFGLSAQTPSIGIILSEAVKHISLGDWWLVFFPGTSLVLLVKSFDNIGESLRMYVDPQMRYI